jgi:hypothetical protein
MRECQVLAMHGAERSSEEQRLLCPALHLTGFTSLDSPPRREELWSLADALSFSECMLVHVCSEDEQDQVQ